VGVVVGVPGRLPLLFDDEPVYVRERLKFANDEPNDDDDGESDVDSFVVGDAGAKLHSPLSSITLLLIVASITRCSSSSRRATSPSSIHP
jgi:hypothetical protein